MPQRQAQASRFQPNSPTTAPGSVRGFLYFVRKLLFLAGLTGLIVFGTPHAVRLVLPIYAQAIARRLPTVSAEEALGSIDNLQGFGPAGYEAIARALIHPQDAVAETALRVLWEPVFTARFSHQSSDEAEAAVRGILEIWSVIPHERRERVGRILRQYLLAEFSHSPQSTVLAERCVRVLQEWSSFQAVAHEAKESRPDKFVPEPSPQSEAAPVNPLRTKSPQRGAPSSESRPLSMKTGETDEGIQLTRYDQLEGNSAASLAPHWEANKTCGRDEPCSPQRVNDFRQESGHLPQSFGPGQIPGIAQPVPSRTATQSSESSAENADPCEPDKATESAEAFPFTPLKSAKMMGTLREDIFSDKTISDSRCPFCERDFEANPWKGDEALWSTLAAGGPTAHEAEQKLRQRGWSSEMISLGYQAFSPDPQERLKAVSKVWELPSADPIVFLKYLLNDSDASVRQEALSAIGTLTEPEIRRIIRHVAQHDPDVQVRLLAQEILAKIP